MLAEFKIGTEVPEAVLALAAGQDAATESSTAVRFKRVHRPSLATRKGFGTWSTAVLLVPILRWGCGKDASFRAQLSGKESPMVVKGGFPRFPAHRSALSFLQDTLPGTGPLLHDVSARVPTC